MVEPFRCAIGERSQASSTFAYGQRFQWTSEFSCSISVVPVNEIQFNQLGALHWLWGVLALLVIVVVGFYLRRRALARFADAAVLMRLVPRSGLIRRHVRAWLLIGALPFLVAGMIDPRWGWPAGSSHESMP